MATTKQELETFLWEGKDKRGKKLKGEKTGRNETIVKAELRQQGIMPSRVRKKPKALFGSTGKRISARDIAIFTRQLATMLTSGIPLVQSFTIISQAAENPRLKKLIKDIQNDVESGSTLAESVAKHPAYFDELYVNLVESGESAGVLDQVLDSIASYKERIESIKGKVKKAMFYPATVMAVAISVTALLLIVVIPQFEQIFQSFGADLPAFTRLVIGASEFLQSNIFWILLVVGGGGYAVVQLKKRNKPFAHFLDRMSLKIPVIGPVLEKSALARFASTLATTFAAGVPLVDALKTVAGATGNVVYEEAVLKIREDVSTGHQMQLAMQQTGLFPPMLIQMTAIGEEAGSLDAMLNKVATFYEEEVNNTVDALSSLLEPLIIVFIGVVVGSLVVAMYLPIFQMAAVM
ncbi:type II secretion system F family protein [Wenzhouxiangella marina]|uniref:Type II secretory pathway protein n=1 Tax=Wenzhouxiangella marina TaxID=1579979 RepID=A0A0K0XX44_9GAMM|nr:type II secretion system F family protein [Wenzhouxiangella marina]AKS42253.1 type II secretory pathway protein [Wenzhouxiangella marina]MBB6085974.1 type IV pilus assembly protein PilC [Wenzhouxiangella marina]